MGPHLSALEVQKDRVKEEGDGGEEKRCSVRRQT